MSEEKNSMPEKNIRLVEYFIALARINAKIIRTYDDYRKILWIHNIPKEPKHCFTQAWGLKEEYDNEVWIEVKKIVFIHMPLHGNYHL